ncbi:hypothetical protein SDC9_160154 [bioreactor metagenome]|uniref:Uncharacterized protein n=1 Tax=bioreactor metagenome TaxID=1076179 RepID=A0A645FK83_9ZZZZ
MEIERIEFSLHSLSDHCSCIFIYFDVIDCRDLFYQYSYTQVDSSCRAFERSSETADKYKAIRYYKLSKIFFQIFHIKVTIDLSVF